MLCLNQGGSKLVPRSRIPENNPNVGDLSQRGGPILDTSNRTIREISAKISSNGTEVQTVPLSNPIRKPSYSVIPSDRGVIISVQGGETLIPRNSREEIAIENTTVEVNSYQQNTDNYPSNEQELAQMTVNVDLIEYEVTAKVVVEHHDEVEVEVPDRTVWEITEQSQNS